MKALWIVQDGVLMGPGAAQTLPYVAALSRCGFAMHLISVEKDRTLADRARVVATREALRASGVGWTALPYGRGPAVARTAVQLARTAATARGLVRREGIDLVHARSYLPALVALALGRPFLFDMRGLWPRERVDGGLWREGGAIFRIASRMERTLVARAAGIVLLAAAGRELLPPGDVPVRVIPTAVDLDRFRPGLPAPAGGEALADRHVYLLAGALGTWYRLEESLDLLALAVRGREDAHVLVLTEEDPLPALRGLASRGVSADRVTTASAAPAEVPMWFSLADAGILLVESAPSKRASCPTKLGELLASGVPVAITPGIGDTEAWISSREVGVVVRDLSEEGLRAALGALGRISTPKEERIRRCRAAARELLDLDRAVAAYAELYREIAERPPCA